MMIAITMHNNANNFTWAFQLLKNISRFAQSGVSSNLWSYQAFPQKVRRGMSWLHFPSAWPSSQSSHQYFCFQSAHPSWFLFNCALPKLYKFTRFLDLRAFAGFCGRFVGNFGRSYAHLYVLVLGIWEWPGISPWDAARMQAMFSHIQNVTCGDSVATRKQNQAN